MTKFKDFTVSYKEDDNGNGYIEGYASTWVRKPDAYGDIVRKGAFVKCLDRLEKEGKTIPFVWSHKLDDISAYIGSCKAHEDDYGLFFKATLDDTPEAQRVRQLFKDGRLSKFSFAYNILDEAQVTLEDGTKANELRELDIFEITACLIPANSTAQVTEVKCGECGVEVTLEEKSGRRNSTKDEQTLKDCIQLLQNLLGEVSEDTRDDEKTAEASEGVKEVNSEEKEQPEVKEKDAVDKETQDKLLEILRNL